MVEFYSVLEYLIFSELTILDDVLDFLLRKLEQYILWLQISVNNSTLTVQEVQPNQGLFRYFLTQI